MNIFCNLKQVRYQENRRVNAGFRLVDLSATHGFRSIVRDQHPYSSKPWFAHLQNGKKKNTSQRGHCEMECMSTQVLSPDVSNKVNSQPTICKVHML